MSHFTVLVVGDDVHEQLAPYQENNMGDCPEEYLVKDEEEDYTYNPNSQWDWYVIGGRWSGFFKLKAHAKSGRYGEKSLLSSVQENKEGYADQLLKKDFDLAGELEKREKECEENWELYNSEQYKYKKITDKYFGSSWGIQQDDTLESYKGRHAGYCTYAILHNGEWIEKGSMGAFGISDDKVTDEQWDRQWRKFVESLPENTQLTVVDCHV